MKPLIAFAAFAAFCGSLLAEDVVIATKNTEEGAITTYTRKGKVVFTSELRLNDGANPRVTHQVVWVGEKKLIETDDLLADVRRRIYPVDGIQITEIGFGEHQQLLIEGDALGYLEVFDVTPKGLLVFRGYDTIHVAVEGGIATIQTAAKNSNEPADGKQRRDRVPQSGSKPQN